MKTLEQTKQAKLEELCHIIELEKNPQTEREQNIFLICAITPSAVDTILAIKTDFVFLSFIVIA